MLYASQIDYVALMPILLSLGLPLFFKARKQHAPGSPVLTGSELMGLGILVAIDVLVVVLYFLGYIKV